MKMNTRRRVQSDGLMLVRLFSLIFVFLIIVDHTSSAEPETADETDLIQINIEGTRPELTVGTGLGISAEIINSSKKNAIYLSEKDLTLIPAPELISAIGELVIGGLISPIWREKTITRRIGYKKAVTTL